MKKYTFKKMILRSSLIVLILAILGLRIYRIYNIVWNVYETALNLYYSRYVNYEAFEKINAATTIEKAKELLRIKSSVKKIDNLDAYYFKGITLIYNGDLLVLKRANIDNRKNIYNLNLANENKYLSLKPKMIEGDVKKLLGENCILIEKVYRNASPYELREGYAWGYENDGKILRYGLICYFNMKGQLIRALNSNYLKDSTKVNDNIITLEKFDNIDLGMSLDDVNNIFGNKLDYIGIDGYEDTYYNYAYRGSTVRLLILADEYKKVCTKQLLYNKDNKNKLFPPNIKNIEKTNDVKYDMTYDEVIKILGEGYLCKVTNVTNPNYDESVRLYKWVYDNNKSFYVGFSRYGIDNKFNKVIYTKIRETCEIEVP